MKKIADTPFVPTPRLVSRWTDRLTRLDGQGSWASREVVSRVYQVVRASGSKACVVASEEQTRADSQVRARFYQSERRDRRGRRSPNRTERRGRRSPVYPPSLSTGRRPDSLGDLGSLVGCV